MVILALVVNVPFFFLFLLKPLLEGGIGSSVDDAEKDMLSSMDKVTKALRIQRKTSVDPPPTPEAIRAAWAAARRSLEGKLLAGTLLSNLEPVVDQSYIRDEDGTIVGRRAGIKGWLLANCPDMLKHYKALMSYKALSDKLRIALCINEPYTLMKVIDFGDAMPVGTTSSGEKTTSTDGTPTPTDRMPTPVDGMPTSTGETSTSMVEKTTPTGRKTPKSLFLISDIRLLNSNIENVVKNMEFINESMSRMGRVESMASLDTVLREQLGLVWMRRGRRDKNAA